MNTTTDRAAGPHSRHPGHDVAAGRAFDLILRVSIVLGSALATGFDAPTAVKTTLTLASAVVVVLPLARRRGRTWDDNLLAGTAGFVVVLVFIGLLLDRVPTGITPATWALGAQTLALVAVVFDWSRTDTTVLRTLPRFTRKDTGRLAWFVAAACLVAVAFVISVHATDVATRPPAQLSAVARDADVVTVEVSGGADRTTYELTTSVVGGTISATTRTVTLGEEQQARFRVRVTSPTTVTLRGPDGERVLRTLRLLPQN